MPDRVEYKECFPHSDSVISCVTEFLTPTKGMETCRCVSLHSSLLRFGGKVVEHTKPHSFHCNNKYFAVMLLVFCIKISL